MRLGLSQTARMEQRLIQSPQMIQAMQILQLSALELEERVEQVEGDLNLCREEQIGRASCRERVSIAV